MKVSVLSWNILADAYIFDSFPQLGPDYRNVLNWKRRRREAVKRILKQHNAGIVCLQECDHPTDVIDDLYDLGYEAIFEKRCCKKQDGLVVGWKYNSFTPISRMRLEFDNLASTRAGMICGRERMKRHNIAAIVSLKHRSKDLVIIVGNAHLYWNPSSEDIKLYQARQYQYGLAKMQDATMASFGKSRAARFLTVAAGDFNSTPTSSVYKLFSKGIMPERRRFKKFVCDVNLRQLCRWMRSLGIDVEFTDINPYLDHNNIHYDTGEFFERLKKEERILLTTSHHVTERRGCPGCMLLLPKKDEGHQIFQRVIDVYGITLDESMFYKRCVLCNTFIEPIDRAALKRTVRKQSELQDNGRAKMLQLEGAIPGTNVVLRTDKVKDRLYKEVDQEIPVEIFNSEEPLYQCSGCKQVYWWGDLSVKKGASALRAEKLVTTLARLAKEVNEKKRSAVAVPAPSVGASTDGWTYLPTYDEQYFSVYYAIAKFKRHTRPSDPSHDGGNGFLGPGHLMNCETVDGDAMDASSPSFTFKTAFPNHQSTNTTSQFDGCIDYLFYRNNGKRSKCRVSAREFLSPPGALLPTKNFPSDHKCLVADFEWPSIEE